MFKKFERPGWDEIQAQFMSSPPTHQFFKIFWSKISDQLSTGADESGIQEALLFRTQQGLAEKAGFVSDSMRGHRQSEYGLGFFMPPGPKRDRTPTELKTP